MAIPKWKEAVRAAEIRASEAEVFLHLALNVEPRTRTVWDHNARYDEPNVRHTIRIWDRRAGFYVAVSNHDGDHMTTWGFGQDFDIARRLDENGLFNVAEAVRQATYCIGEVS